jgi:hypothetical protein
MVLSVLDEIVDSFHGFDKEVVTGFEDRYYRH